MMRHITRAALALILLAIILTNPVLSQADSGTEYTFPQEKSFSLPSGALISVQNTRGDINIQGGEQKQVVVKATKRVQAGSRKEAEEWAQKVNIIFDEREKGLFIEAKIPRAWSESLGDVLSKLLGKKPSVQVDFDIQTPRQVEVKAGCVSGDIYIVNIDGEVTVDVVSGGVKIEKIGGDLSIDAVSGDMLAQDVLGNLKIDATSGDAEIVNIGADVQVDVTSGDVIGKGIKGNLTIDGTSGDVNVEAVHGDVHIDVTSGDITVKQRGGDLWIDTSSGDVWVETAIEKNGRYRVDTSSGQITFRIPKSSSCTLDLETSGGRIRAKLPTTIESVSRTRLRGTMGDGGAQLNLSTSGGNIDLLPSD
ncbi:MAG: hypothetical protein AMJ92_07175 [candidate division Zixibacteria bacterium SM23_81]|nr:MAG: hypothetical protein AMJ92_07175 [candidate division Zixibacteria bacterium SM23_81]